MTEHPLVLSLFPGIGLLDRAFEEEGFCVVRGPDLLWGGDIHRFHPPAGKFEGVIGGPPCQMFSRLNLLLEHIGRKARFGNLIPEFERCVREAHPTWFLMENVVDAPAANVEGYYVSQTVIDNRHVATESGIGPEQQRRRRFSFGRLNGSSLVTQLAIEYAVLEAPLRKFAVTGPNAGRTPWKIKRTPPVTGSDGGASLGMTKYKLPEALELQGLPADLLDHAPFTAQGKLQAVGNGVPLPMGRAVAKAVKQSMGYTCESARQPASEDAPDTNAVAQPITVSNG